MAGRPTTVGFIPARGGSKRLPRKNIRSFAGRPLIYYSILFSQVEQLDHCVVSTDDAEIADVARAFGADVVARPPELATDEATTASVAVHALEALAVAGRLPGVMVLLQPNCPLRPRGLARQAVDLLAAGSADSVVSVTDDHRKSGTIRDDRFVPRYQPGVRSQDMSPLYFENGVIYATWTRVVLETGSVFGRTIQPLVIDPLFALGDIDTPLDFAIAEHLFDTHPSQFDWVPARPADADRAEARSASGSPARA